MNSLRHIRDAVYLVVRRWRTQWRPRCRVPDARDVFRNFARRKLPAFARLRALRHFDFEFLRVYQIIRSHPESPRSHLLDFVGRVWFTLIQRWILAALSRVAASAKRVHGQRQRPMRFEA